jgi:hypothetical protein
VVLLVAAALGVVGKHWLARREVAWLDRQWLAGNEEDLGRFSAEQQLEAYVQVGDGTTVAAALASVYREERADLEALTSRLRHAVLVDHGLSLLRGQIAAAFTDRAELLGSWAASYQSETRQFTLVDTSGQFEALVILDEQVDQRLTQEQTHWGVAPAKSPAPTVYPAARAALARLSPWLDQPTGTVLLAASATDGVMERLDLDRSQQRAGSVPADGSILQRHGYLAYLASDGVMAVSPDGSGTPRLLAASHDYFFAANDPNDLWVTYEGGRQEAEIDGTGRVVAPSLTPPLPAVADTAKGFVLSAETGIEIWNPATHQVTCHLPGGSAYGVLAASGDLVVWLGGDNQLTVSNVASCTNLFRQPTDDSVEAPVAAISPDGQTVALSTDPVQPAAPGMVLIGAGSGTLTPVPEPELIDAAVNGPIGGIAWSVDGRRLFWLYPKDGSFPSLIVTWKVGDPTAQPLRAVNLHLTAPLLTVGVL